MNNAGFDALPAAQRKTVRSALVAAFGSAPIGAITPISGGASTASTFCLESGGRRYLLRMEGAANPAAQSSPVRLHAHRSGGRDCTEDPLYL